MLGGSTLFLLIVTTAFGATSSQSSTRSFPALTVGRDEFALYYVNVSIGTPPQPQSLRVDIAQPYVWVLSDSDCDINTDDNICFANTTYFMGNSTSARTRGDYIYQMNFIDTIFINGTAAMDSLSFTSVEYLNVDASNAFSTNSAYPVKAGSSALTFSNISFFNTIFANHLTMGSLGLSGKINGGGSDRSSEKFDESFFLLDILKSNGIIDASSYSLWLGNDTLLYYNELGTGPVSSCGTLLFGAVDPSKFEGDFASFDMLPSYNQDDESLSYGYPILPMGPLYIESHTGERLNMTSDKFLEPVLIDSRFATTRLPADTIIQLAIQIEATYVEALDGWVVPCSVGLLGVKLDFTFGDLEIQVPLEEFLITSINPKTNASMHLSDGEDACVLTLYPNTDTGYSILGKSFLKRIYLAMDLEDHAIAIAQAKQPKVEVNPVSFQVKAGTNASTKSKTPTTEAGAITKSLTESPTQILAISSGHIPYATTLNITRTKNLVLSPFRVRTSVTNFPGELIATLYSDGLISAARSFYNTERTSSTKSSSSTTFDTLSIKAGNQTATFSAAAHKLLLLDNHQILSTDYHSSWTLLFVSFLAVVPVLLTFI